MMRDALDFLSTEWARSGNPAWLKAAMLVILAVLAVLLVRAVVGIIRECRRLIHTE